MGIKALTFDVFGTLVDWRTAAIRELEPVSYTHLTLPTIYSV